MLAEVRQKGEKVFIFFSRKKVKKEKGAYMNQTLYTVCGILM